MHDLSLAKQSEQEDAGVVKSLEWTLSFSQLFAGKVDMKWLVLNKGYFQFGQKAMKKSDAEIARLEGDRYFNSAMALLKDDKYDEALENFKNSKSWNSNTEICDENIVYINNLIDDKTNAELDKKQVRFDKYCNIVFVAHKQNN